MSLKDTEIERKSFYGAPKLDDDLPIVNELFWSSLIGHIEMDSKAPPRAILDVGCHSGGLLYELNRRFAPAELFGIEPLAPARAAAAQRLDGIGATLRLVDVSEWGLIPPAAIDLLTS